MFGAMLFGVVCGWLVALVGHTSRLARTFIAAAIATVAAAATAFWVGSLRAALWAVGGMALGLALHTAWRSELKRLARRNR